MVPTVVAPEPAAPRCGYCEGSGEVSDPDLGAVGCADCGGTGAGDWVPPALVVLLPTHTHKRPGRRRAVYDPNAGRLRLTQGTRTVGYTVREIPGVHESFGRAFELEKDDGEVRHVQCGPGGVSCSCGGEIYKSSAKANQRAFEAGGEVYPTLGCGHLDAVAPLLAAGWFDLMTREAVG